MIAFIKDLVAHGMKTRLVSIGRKTEIAGFRIWEESRMAEYIDREAVEKFIENGLNNPDKKKAFGNDAIEIMAEVHYMPAADVAPVVRCRECKHYKEFKTKKNKQIIRLCYRMGKHDMEYPVKPDDFCSYGEEKNE